MRQGVRAGCGPNERQDRPSPREKYPQTFCLFCEEEPLSDAHDRWRTLTLAPVQLREISDYLRPVMDYITKECLGRLSLVIHAPINPVWISPWMLLILLHLAAISTWCSQWSGQCGLAVTVENLNAKNVSRSCGCKDKFFAHSDGSNWDTVDWLKRSA